jgi:hypothetical protein
VVLKGFKVLWRTMANDTLQRQSIFFAFVTKRGHFVCRWRGAHKEASCIFKRSLHKIYIIVSYFCIDKPNSQYTCKGSDSSKTSWNNLEQHLWKLLIHEPSTNATSPWSKLPVHCE